MIASLDFISTVPQYTIHFMYYLVVSFGDTRKHIALENEDHGAKTETKRIENV